jgi:Tfp pilus assembly protein PilE/transposase
MVELLVVIAVLALLISLVIAVASRAIRQQRARNTEQLMQNVALAIDQFATENPLRAVYDRKGRQTFGKYPPYQLANAGVDGSVAQALELDHALTPGSHNPPDNIRQRLALDLSGGRGPGNVGNWVSFPRSPDGNDDSRALYAYLRVFSPGALGTIPESALKPIERSARDYVNPRGSGGTPGTQGGEDWVDVLAPHDAWGVPLDYMLYVKCEYRLAPGDTRPSWVVTERRPVLRSLGIEREAYDAIVNSQPDPQEREFDAGKWLFSEELPRPWAALTDDPAYREGILDSGPGTSANGWVRAVAADESYAYRPDGDTEEP